MRLGPALAPLARALAGAGLVLGALLLVFPPGRYDLTAGDMTGTMGHDEGYWSGAARTLAGETRFDDYDRRRALALALPQNVVSAAAYGVGLSGPASRAAGSYLAAAALGALAGVVGWGARLALLAFLLAPPVFGHLEGDLAEGPTLALSAWWGFAIVRGRVGVAAALAAVGVFQKGCGLFLGLGTVVAALGHANGVLRGLARAAAGLAVAAAACALVAWGVFGEPPLDLLARPFRATGDFWRAPTPLSIAIEAAVPGHHLFGEYLALPFLGAALLASTRRVPGAWLVAALGGLLYRGYFAAGWRLIPVLPLLLLPVLAPPLEPGERPSAGGVLLALVLAVQAVGAFGAWAGWSPGAAVLVGLGVALGAVLLWVHRTPCARSLVPAGLVTMAVACAVGPWRATRHPEWHTSVLHELAARVAHEVPLGATLVAQPVVSLDHRGVFYLAPFERFWREELARERPGSVYRVRAVDRADDEPSYGMPEGYSLAKTTPLGRYPYAPSSTPRDLVLDVWTVR